MTTGNPTLKDVARDAGVSTMAVSVVLNGARSATRVSDATRQRIIAAAERLGYRPNAAARGLQRRRMDTIGVVAIINGFNLYFFEVLNGILEAAATHQQNTTVLPVPDWESSEERLRSFCDGRVDGMVLIAPQLAPETAAMLSGRTRLVTIHGDAALPLWNIDVDDEAGAFRAVRYLIGLGHRRLLHLTGSPGLGGTIRRVAGYRAALDASAIPYDESLVLRGYFSVGSGRERTEAFLNSGAPLPDAIFCASDAIAAGCIEALTAHGLRVPEDISVMGFDDTLEARMTRPPLTTIRQPLHRLGARAVELLLAQIDQSAVDPPTTEHLTLELVERDSVGPPR